MGSYGLTHAFPSAMMSPTRADEIPSTRLRSWIDRKGWARRRTTVCCALPARYEWFGQAPKHRRCWYRCSPSKVSWKWQVRGLVLSSLSWSARFSTPSACHPGHLLWLPLAATHNAHSPNSDGLPAALADDVCRHAAIVSIPHEKSRV